MDEKEREDSLPAEIDTTGADLDADDTQEEPPRLYFGRFTPGVWYGGVLGIALSYILTGLLGLINERFGLNLRPVMDSPFFKYGIIIALCYGLGKLGGMLEKRRQQND